MVERGSIRRVWGRGLSVLLALTACGVTSVAAMPASVASASTSSSCAKWDIAGTWAIIQSNEKTISSFYFAEKGKDLTGSAVSGSSKGTISGTMKPDSATFTIKWSASVTGHYFGKISNRSMIGHTYFKSHRANWSGTGPTTCRG